METSDNGLMDINEQENGDNDVEEVEGVMDSPSSKKNKKRRRAADGSQRKAKKSKKNKNSKKADDISHLEIPTDDAEALVLATAGDPEFVSETKDDDVNDDADKSKTSIRKRRSKVSFPTKTADEVCSELGLNNVELEYMPEDFETLTCHKAFSAHIRPLLAEDNPNVPHSKLMPLVSAKWREFSLLNPDKAVKINRKDDDSFDDSNSALTPGDNANSNDLETPENRIATRKARIAAALASGLAPVEKVSKRAVAPLKIKLGRRKKKKNSSDEENNGFNTSDEEFERQLAEAAVIQAEEKAFRDKRPKKKKVPTATLR